MKLNIGKRIVLFIHWLLSLLIAIAVIADEFVSKLYARIGAVVDARYLRIAVIAFFAVYAVFSIAVLVMVLRRGRSRNERGFITMDASDSGKVRISVGAIEQMVKQAVGSVDGIADMRISINNLDDAIAINVNVSIVNGSHVPTVTMNMQRAIRQFVELNCGVAVRSVSISVQTVVNAGDSSKKGRKGEFKAVPAALNESALNQNEAVPEVIQEEAPAFSVEEAVEESFEQPAAFEPEMPAEEPAAEPVEAAEHFEPLNEAYESENDLSDAEEDVLCENLIEQSEPETVEICSNEDEADASEEKEEKI